MNKLQHALMYSTFQCTKSSVSLVYKLQPFHGYGVQASRRELTSSQRASPSVLSSDDPPTVSSFRFSNRYLWNLLSLIYSPIKCLPPNESSPPLFGSLLSSADSCPQKTILIQSLLSLRDYAPKRASGLTRSHCFSQKSSSQQLPHLSLFSHKERRPSVSSIPQSENPLLRTDQIGLLNSQNSSYIPNQTPTEAIPSGNRPFLLLPSSDAILGPGLLLRTALSAPRVRIQNRLLRLLIRRLVLAVGRHGQPLCPDHVAHFATCHTELPGALVVFPLRQPAQHLRARGNQGVQGLDGVRNS